MRRILRLLVPLALAGGLHAQTTHIVNNGPAFDFVPADITIDVGDTVKWVWVGGLHNVESGVGGISDGIFSSGAPPPPPPEPSSAITFDQAFLSANPVVGDVYNYFCVIHVALGQTGTVTVKQPPVVTPYGCVNPSGSLVSLGGSPVVNSTWTVGVDNPLGTQPAGSLAFLGVSTGPAPGFPCGLPLPGFGMSAPGAVGELLINTGSPGLLATLGPAVWSGAGSPAGLDVVIPDNASLVGFGLNLQGLMFDPTAGGGGIAFGAAEAFAVTIGS